ncbi:mammalian ependymin-related protein 1-like [Corticium candelabrum]|uniref:mammalian ependymin-related protein 1-like n=1 Tax=Corticium candelabrum TaxID=121492 RepID=UPI002E256CCB|nr:mammalian ependymin-related protein 1-like [Corticium candelabrum]
MFVQTVIFSCLLFSISLADPLPCKSPQQWKGSLSEYDHGDGQHNYYNVTYDAIKHRRRTVEEVRADRPGRTYYEWLFLYDENVFYELNLATRVCRKISSPGSWRSYEIPPNATFEHDLVLGVGPTALKVEEWSDRMVAPSLPETWSGTFTVDGCVPVTEVVIVREISKSFSTVFYNIDTSPLGPDDFTPPKECKSA